MVLHDPDAWGGDRLPYGELGRLATSIRACVEVELHLRERPTEIVRPIGLVLKAGHWYLVSHHERGPAVRSLHDLRGLRITRWSFERPGRVDLRGCWHDYVDRFEQEGEIAPADPPAASAYPPD
ncbi:MAG: WYL domain-containing protein [Actinomycetota bacterium]|nr:WYL domain-containing protein [Actinomycetota bacterium]